MATTRLPNDFKEFLRLLNAHGVDYLIVGGYAVALHGHPRSTVDLDIWVAVGEENAARVAGTLREFGFAPPELSPELFLAPDRIIRLGHPPMRIEILTGVDGVTFQDSWRERIQADLDGIPVNVISLARLRENKKASGRPKDLDDLENLPG